MRRLSPRTLVDKGPHRERPVRRAAVLGSPIGHSKSPQLHRRAYQYLGLDIDYTRIQVDESSLDQFLAGEGSQPGWAGWSVTMPLKTGMVRHMTSVSPRVQTLGVLNTVVISELPGGGRTLYGANTDVDGIIGALAGQRVPHDAPGGSTMGILGAGGTAASALAAAQEQGFQEAIIYARSLDRASALELLADRLGIGVQLSPISAFGHDIAQAKLAVVVSTLPARAADPLTQQLSAQDPGHPVLLDIAYDPWPSALAQAWESRGWPVVSGLEMLLHQAVIQVELFTRDQAHPAASLASQEHAQMVAQMRAAL